MAGKKLKLLLNKSVEGLGIVGDIVKVRPGFARNFLLPHQLAERPTPTKIDRLKDAREAALAELARLRKDRESLLARMESVVVTIQRSCNDQGHLYGSVTQRDISDALIAAGYAVDTRSVRLNQSIRRVGEYHVPIQFEKDLRTDITLKVEPDRALEQEREEMEIDEEGELVERPRRERRPHRDESGEAAAPATGSGTQGERPARPARKEKAQAKA